MLAKKRSSVSSRFAVAALTTALLATSASQSHAAVYDLSWTGQFAGFSLDGRFAYDMPSGDGVVRKDDFTRFDFSLQDADGNLITSFTDNHLENGFNANFNPETQTLLQEGRWDEGDGLSIGADRGEGLNIWSIGFPGGGDVFNPHLHVTDWNNEFTDRYAPQFGSRPEMFPHIDGAFFLKSVSDIKGEGPNDVFGEQIKVSAVPLPAPALMLITGLLALAGWRRLSPAARRL